MMAKKKRRVTRLYSKTNMENWPNSKLRDDYVWPVFSRFIRLRDCLKTTGTFTQGMCVTCGRTYPMGQLQAGHFIPGRTDAVLFDERGVHAQCYRCNCRLQGMWHKYYRFMQEEYGQEVIEEMIDQAEDKTKLHKDELYRLHDYYELRIKLLVGEE